MRARSAGLWLCAWACLGCAVAWGADPRTQERVWTDQQGRKVTAKLLRVERDVVYLDLGGRISQLSFDQLSPADQAFLAAPDPADITPRGTNKTEPDASAPPMEEPRIWTINNRQVVAAYAGADEDAIYLQGPSGEIRLAYEAILTEADAADVAGRLRATRPDLADRVIKAFETNTGAKFPSAARTSPPVTDDTTGPMSPVEITGEPPMAGQFGDEEEMVHTRPEIMTADKVLAAADAKQAAGSPPSDDLARFRNRAIMGGVALVAVIAAVLGFSWFTMKRKPE